MNGVDRTREVAAEASVETKLRGGRTLHGVRARRSSIFESRATVVDAPRLEDRPPVGTVLDGRYVLGEMLGQGGMGYVLAATHAVLGKRLAVKVLRREMTRDPAMAELFREEARAASSIGHPNIVEVTDFGTLPQLAGTAADGAGASYFVMERLEGACLADVVEDEGALEVRRAVEIVRQMASALHAAHELGILHRDVKPENVMLTTRGGRVDHVKILDFGLAKLGHDDLRIIGTPHYMSPEQGSAKRVDRRSDVYSLGVVLFELVTGQLPFDESDPLRLLRRHALEAIPSAKKLRPELPDAVCLAIERAMAKSPGDRPATMTDFVALLASIEPPSVVQPRRADASVPMGLVDVGPIPVDPNKPRASFSVPKPSTPPPAPATQVVSSRWTAPLVVTCLALIVIVIALALHRPAPPTALAPTTLAPTTLAPAPVAPLAAPTPTATHDREPPAATPVVSAPVAPPSTTGAPPLARARRVTGGTTAPESTAPTPPATRGAQGGSQGGSYYSDQNLLDPW